MLRNLCLFFLIGIPVFLTGCSNNRHLEKQIQAEVLQNFAGIASLEVIYTLTFAHFEKNIITSDDLYIQKDIVSMDYGFALDDKSIQVVDSGGRKTLQVRLGEGRVLATNRTSLGMPETTHKGYLPVDATGKSIDVDEKLNKDLEELKRKYDEENLATAKENLKTLFRIIAEKYDLDLDFQ